MRTHRLVIATAAALALAALGGGAGWAQRNATTATPPPSSFSTHVNNPWFPVVPGTRYMYRGVKDGKPSQDIMIVTHETRTIAGVRCVVVSDRLWLSGHLEERTTDYYAQDKEGNVWYFGEETEELDEHGHVTSREGTWHAGTDGAVPGIYIPGNPKVGQTARQEYYKGHAEDHFRVVSIDRSVLGSGTANAVLTEEWTPLEPGVLDHKLYVRGIGTVLEQSQKGANERNELISVQKGS